MRLAFALFLLLCVAPFFFVTAAQAFRNDDPECVDAQLGEVVSGAELESRHVRVRGRLVREAAPDAILAHGAYYFPFVTESEADALRSRGDWAPPAGPFVLMSVSGDRLPVEAFLPPAPDTDLVVTPEVTLEATRARTSYVPEEIRARLGLADDAEVIVLESESNRFDRGAGVFALAFGLLALWGGVRSFRRWRRERRAFAAHVQAVKARLAAGDSAPSVRAAASSSATVSALGCGAPLAKIVAVLLFLGLAVGRIAGRSAPDVARTAGKAASRSADEVARGVAHAGDELVVGVARAADDAVDAAARAADGGPTFEPPSAADVLGEAVGQASNAKTAYELLGDPRAAIDRGNPSGRMTLTSTISISSDRFARTAEATFELVATQLEYVAKVRRSDGSSGGGEVSEDELPDRRRGEFVRATVSPGTKPGTVLFTQDSARSVDGGYLVPSRAAGEMEFVHGGTWEDLAAGRPCHMRFTEAGAGTFAEGLLDALEGDVRRSEFVKDYAHVEIDIEWEVAPEYSARVEGDTLGLELVRPATFRIRLRYWD